MKSWKGSYRWISGRILRGGFKVAEGKENKVYKQLVKIISEMEKIKTTNKGLLAGLEDLKEWKKFMESKF